MFKFWNLLVLLTLVLGCSPPKNPTTAKNIYTPSKECKTLYNVKGDYSVVVIHKGCLPDKELTTITIAVLNTSEEGRLAADESARIILRCLGYTPRLTLLTMGKIKQVPIYIMVVPKKTK